MIRVSDVMLLLFPESLNWVPQVALDRGGRMHFYVELFLNNYIMGQGDFPKSLGSMGEHILIGNEEQRILAVLDWIITQGIEPEIVEGEYTHRHGFVGHPDLVGRRKSKELCLDWKFAEEIILQNEVQAEAYRQLTRAPVWLVLCPLSAEIRIKKCEPRPDLWALFLSALNVLKFQQT